MVRKESPIVIFFKAFPPRIIGAMMLQIALINGSLMILAVMLGMSLDRSLSTRPLLTIALPVLAAVLSLVVAWRLALITSQRSRKAYLGWKRSLTRSASTDGLSHVQMVMKISQNAE
ncbi:MAG: AtpZ/AtpI family protein [Thermoflexales bacterium]